MSPRIYASGGKIRKVLIGAVAVLFVGLIASGIYLVYIRKTGPTKDTGNLHVTTLPPVTHNTTVVISNATKHYVSTNFGVEFDYPSDWTISGDSPTSSQVVATSPELKLKATDNTLFNGQILFIVSNKQQPLSEFAKGNAVAVLASEKINYTKPSASQRAATYLSFLRYAGMQPGSLEGIYVTGDVGYQYSQAIPEADLTPVDPLVKVIFEQCGAAGCKVGDAQVGIAPSMWQESSFSGPLKTLFKLLIVD